VEGADKEFRLRRNPMAILTGQRSYYTLLVFVGLKMELTRRSKVIGKVFGNLSQLVETG
jgi:hypothetical protein